MVGNVVGFTGAGGRTTRTEAATLFLKQVPFLCVKNVNKSVAVVG